MNYFVGNMCDDDILSSNEYIILQQDLHNTNDKNRYQKILGNLYLFLYNTFLTCDIITACRSLIYHPNIFLFFKNIRIKQHKF